MQYTLNSFIIFHNNNYPVWAEEYKNFGVLQVNVSEGEIPEQELDIVFSIDNSGSMTDICKDGRSKLNHVKHTISNILRLFSEQKKTHINVAVQTFDDKLKKIFDFVQVTEDNVDSLISDIDKIYSNGATDLHKPIVSAQSMLNERRTEYSSHKRIHIELTDGEDTCSNTHETLTNEIDDDIRHIFIGFGTTHDSILLNTLGSTSVNEYRFVDKLESAGFVYGEIVHNILTTVIDNAKITVDGGLIYDWMKNEWTTTMNIGPLRLENKLVFHVKSDTPDEMTGELFTYEVKEGVYEKVILDDICILPDLLDEDNNIVDKRDFTQYIYRQRVQELLHASSVDINNRTRQFYGLERVAEENVEINLKQLMRELFLDMKKYMKDHDLINDVFWKVLLDDIYIVYKTAGTRFYHMYAASRKLSQGRQYTYSVNNIEECVKEARRYNRRMDHPFALGTRGRRGVGGGFPPQRHQTIQMGFNDDDEESQMEQTQDLNIQNGVGNNVFTSDAVTQVALDFSDSLYRSYHTESARSHNGRPALIRSPSPGSPLSDQFMEDEEDMMHETLDNTISPYSTQTMMMTMRHVSG